MLLLFTLDQDDLSQRSESKTLLSDEKPDCKFVKKDDPEWQDLDYCVEVRNVKDVTLSWQHG